MLSFDYFKFLRTNFQTDVTWAIQLRLWQISSPRDGIEEIEVLPKTIYSVWVSPLLKIKMRCYRLIISSVLRTNFQTDITWAIQLRLRQISSPRDRIEEIDVLPNTIYSVWVSPFLKIQLFRPLFFTLKFEQVLLRYVEHSILQLVSEHEDQEELIHESERDEQEEHEEQVRPHLNFSPTDQFCSLDLFAGVRQTTLPLSLDLKRDQGKNQTKLSSIV